MLMDLYDIFYKNIELFGAGGKVYGKLTTTSFDAHTASLRLALSYAGFLMTLLATRQEVSKKRARTFPPGPPFLCRTTKMATRDHIKALDPVPQVLPPRAAGSDSENIHPSPHKKTPTTRYPCDGCS